MKNITVDKAITRGKWLCLFWPLIFFAAPMAAGAVSYTHLTLPTKA